MEKPFVLSLLVSLLESGFDCCFALSLAGWFLNEHVSLFCSHSYGWRPYLDGLLVNDSLVDVDVDGVSGGHQVVVVYDLNNCQPCTIEAIKEVVVAREVAIDSCSTRQY